MVEALIAGSISLVTSAVCIAVSWGMSQARTSTLEREQGEIRSDLANIRREYVQKEHFHAITNPLQEQIGEVQRDIKRILIILSRNESYREDKGP